MNNRSFAFTLILLCCCAASSRANPVWPAPPAAPVVEFVKEIRCAELERETGFFGRIARSLAGRNETDRPRLPFDILLSDESLFMICQGQSALIEIDQESGSYRRHECAELPLRQPVSLCAVGAAILITDSGNGVVYRYENGQITPWIVSGLGSPTGIAALESAGSIYVVDTSEHIVKVYDLSGQLLQTIGRRALNEAGLNFPTFAAGDRETLLVNDTLNYQIKRYSVSGNLLAAFGQEGAGPGSFSRAKDLAVDEGHQIYVVDNMLDNLQIFDTEGRLKLVIGGRGRGAGEFWSPTGIDIAGNLIYVADTFNHRVQVLRYLGD